MRQCNHKRMGLVSNQAFWDFNDKTRPLATTATCDRPQCIANAIKWSQGKTGEKAIYYSDAARGVR